MPKTKLTSSSVYSEKFLTALTQTTNVQMFLLLLFYEELRICQKGCRAKAGVGSFPHFLALEQFFLCMLGSG